MLFTINPSNSVVANANFNPAFNEDSAAADMLTVNSGAYLIALGTGAAAAFLDNTLAWKVTINGWLFSQQSHGIHLAAGNAARSTITISVDNEVGSANNHAILAQSAVDVVNSGLLSGGLKLESDATITNNAAGTIEASTVAIVIGGAGDRTIKNSGAITGGSSAIFDMSGNSNDTLTNSGTISGNVVLSGGVNSVVNSGIIDSGVFGGDGTDTIRNAKTIAGPISLGDGNDKVTNSGAIGGIVDLGADDDIFVGGEAAEMLRDGGGADRYSFGAGDDTYLAKRLGGVDGTDYVDGGAGIDTYDASDATDGILVNLDSVNHDLSPIAPGAAPAPKNTAVGADVSGPTAHDTVVRFENAKGGSSSDIIYGSASANVLEGNGGADILFGFAGNDALRGGAGSDSLFGGAGKDLLDGGLADSAADYFIFTSMSDSRSGKAARDTIINFEDGFDLIHLEEIDARAATATDDAFVYLNGNSNSMPAVAFSGNGIGGELRSVWTATGYVIEGDVNGDAKADFAIDMADPDHMITLTGADFLL